MSISRSLLRDQAADLVREKVCKGQLAAGQRIAEVSTAKELGVSRTPLREALIQLEREGLVVASPQHGFQVAPLRAQEVRDLYPILAALESLALGATPTLEPRRRDRLAAINDRLRGAHTPVAALRLDTEWHEALLEGSANATARSMASEIRRRVQRYELAFMRQEGVVDSSSDQHDGIVAALVRGDVEVAAHDLSAQWTDSIATILGWVEAQDSEDPGSTS